MIRVAFLVILAFGCYAVRTHPCRALVMAANVHCSDSALPGFTGETTTAQTTAWWAGVAGLATAVVAFL